MRPTISATKGEFGDDSGGAVGRFYEFGRDRSEGDLSGVESFDARMLGVDLVKSRLVRFGEKARGAACHYDGSVAVIIALCIHMIGRVGGYHL